MNTGFLLFALHLPERRMFNEWYARDISRKIRSSQRLRGNAGVPLSLPPYGYVKSPDNPKYWIVDDEAAAVVRRIYQMCIDGYGIDKTAAIFEQEEILKPTEYWKLKGVRKPGRKPFSESPYHWSSNTVNKILTSREYMGDVVNFKTYSKSYKLHCRRADQERYRKMSADYEAEQERLKLESEVIEEWVEQREEMNDGLDAFIALTQKYVDVEELTQTIVNEYIKKIIVYAPDKSSGKRKQKVKIFFNFVDDVDIPVISEPIVTQTTYERRKTA